MWIREYYFRTFTDALKFAFRWATRDKTKKISLKQTKSSTCVTIKAEHLWGGSVGVPYWYMFERFKAL